MEKRARRRQPRVFADMADFNARLTANHEAFERALMILEPYPLRMFPKSIGPLSLSSPLTLNRKETAGQITDLACGYWRNRHYDVDSPRISETARSFREIVRHSEGLARELKNLQQSEIELMAKTRADVPDPQTRMDHIVLRLPNVGLPFDKREPFGSGVVWLEYLSKHTAWILTRLYAVGDHGGPTNTNRHRQASPTWKLIGHCWAFFERLADHSPSGTTNGSFHKFLCAIHELVTGEYVVRKFGKELKQYAGIKRRQNLFERQLDEVSGSIPELTQEQFMSTLIGNAEYRVMIPPAAIVAAEKLFSDLIDLDYQLRHGSGRDL